VSDLKVLMLNYEFPPIGGGGANAHFYLLKQYAENPSLHVDVLTSASRPGVTQEQFSENVTIYRVGLHKKSLHVWRKVEVLEWLYKARAHYRRLLEKQDYDLVHAFFGFPSAWLCYRSRVRLPYMVSLRGSDVPGENARLQRDYKILAPVFRRIWQNAHVLVACSQGLRERAQRFLPTVAVDVIPNGVDLNRFTPGPSWGLDRPQTQCIRLLTVGRLSETKRVDLLIETVEILAHSERPVQLTIVGTGSQHGRLTQMVRDRSLGDLVHMTGRLDQDCMPQVYQEHDLLVSASFQEGMSNAMLEAMAAGLPIVTTACEGLDELIQDNGLIVDQAQASLLAQAINDLLSDSQTYQRMSQAARARAEQFSWASVAQQYIDHYHAVAGREAGDT
jgi:glycosyltransferase involved in cell wall biosynthesis